LVCQLLIVVERLKPADQPSHHSKGWSYERQQVRVFFLMIVVAVSCSAKSRYQSETKASMLELCFKLWKSTNFGWDDNPKPSKQDTRIAKEINRPVYTISAFGIWSVNPDGDMRQEANDQWHRGIKEKKRSSAKN
jgi:hypothetical protein